MLGGNKIPTDNERTMNGITAYCGLVCHTCPIYLATRKLDREEQAGMRAEIARILAKRYGMQCAPEDVTDCDGCPVEGGRLFSTCRNCAIRSCARARGLASCAYCGEYACERLEAFLVSEPAARLRLEQIRHGQT